MCLTVPLTLEVKTKSKMWNVLAQSAQRVFGAFKLYGFLRHTFSLCVSGSDAWLVYMSRDLPTKAHDNATEALHLIRIQPLQVQPLWDALCRAAAGGQIIQPDRRRCSASTHSLQPTCTPGTSASGCSPFRAVAATLSLWPHSASTSPTHVNPNQSWRSWPRRALHLSASR